MTANNNNNSNNQFTHQQFIVFIIIASVHFFSSACVSLQAPFYPSEAESKGATATEYGFVFGIYELIGFLTSTFFGKLVKRVGAKRLLSIGMLVCSVSVVCFGLLDFIWDRVLFIVLSFVFRTTEALGAASAVVSAFALTGMMFPENVATMFATLETFYGVGFIVGPTIGGLLYSIGGFTLPFLFMGVVTGSVGISMCFLNPAIDEKQSQRQVSIISVLRIPSVIVDACGVSGVALSAGFLNAILEPHIREFNLSPLIVGLIFVTSGLTYAVVAPFVGRVLDKYPKPKLFMIIGSILEIISFSIVGPAPFVPFTKSLPLVITALVIHGLGLGAVNVPTFSDMINSCISRGFPDGIATYGVVSGVWTSSYALGAFVGPSVAGVLYDQVGFENATIFTILVHICILTMTLIYVTVERKNKKRLNTTSLIKHENLHSSKNGRSDESAKLKVNGESKNGYGGIQR